MSRKAGVISINLNAGTAKFMADMDAANAKIGQFGTAATGNSRAAGAELKALEGKFPIRAAAAFLASIQGLGPVVKAGFPVVGAIALGGVLVDTTEKIYKFFKAMQDAPERNAAAFRGLTSDLHLTNDELRVANDRLENEIAKLEGHHQNTVKLTLDEIRAAADKLAKSLNTDLENLNKLLAANHVTGIFGGGTGDIKKLMGGESGFGGVGARVAEILEEGNRKIASAKTTPEALSARTAAMAAANRELAAALEEVNKKLAAREAMQKGGVPIPGRPHAVTGTSNQRVPIEQLRRSRLALMEAQDFIPLSLSSVDLTAKRDKDAAARANAQQDRPFEDRMKQLGAEIEAVKAKLEAIGKPEAAQIIAKAFGAAQKAIEETNKALERHNSHLTEQQKGHIRAKELTLATAEVETEWRTKLAASTSSIADRIRSQELLTAAIGKGYEATRSANVETRIMQQLRQHFDDPAWMKKHQGEVEGLRTGFTRQFDAEHAEQSAKAVDSLNDQIELERELARVQAQGAEAVRQLAFTVKLRQMEKTATKEQIQAEIELFNEKRTNVNAADVAKINEQAAARQRLTSAILGGAEAERKAALENKYEEIRRAGDQPSGIFGIGQKELAERGKDTADRQGELLAAGLRPAMAAYNQIEEANLRIGAIEKKITDDKKINLYEEIALRDLENQRLQLLAEQSLQLRGVRDGVRAFFLEMQTNAKSAASIVYEAMHSALDRSSSEMANLLSGKKTNFGKAFGDIGHQMLQSSIKSGAQFGLGKFGEHFAPAKKFADALGLNKPDGSSRKLAFWVQLADGISPDAGGKEADSNGSKLASTAGAFIHAVSGGGGVGRVLQGIGGIFSKLTDKMLSKALGNVFGDWFGGARAEGGGVDPGSAYMVGEKGPEMFVPSSSGRIIPHGAGGDNHVHYHIDARGADLGVMTRIEQGMRAMHNSAVATSVLAAHDQARRTPARS
jgi:hypothetical protein